MKDTNVLENPNQLPPETSNLFLEFTVKMTEALNRAQTPTPVTESSPLVGIKLDGSNYVLWSQILEMNNAGKDKLGYLNGDTPPPPLIDPSFNKWRTENAICQELDNKVTGSHPHWQLHTISYRQRDLGCCCLMGMILPKCMNSDEE